MHLQLHRSDTSDKLQSLLHIQHWSPLDMYTGSLGDQRLHNFAWPTTLCYLAHNWVKIPRIFSIQRQLYSTKDWLAPFEHLHQKICSTDISILVFFPVLLLPWKFIRIFSFQKHGRVYFALEPNYYLDNKWILLLRLYKWARATMEINGYINEDNTSELLLISSS